MSSSYFLSLTFSMLWSVPDIPLYLGVLKHRVARVGAIFLPIFFMMDFCLYGIILNYKAFCFGAIPCMPDCLRRPTGSTTFRAQVRGLIT